ncbi:MAG TPA: hypothetical protein VHC18_00665 [Amycolatopsis sp.]|nr:hypothetical protein [Amycolatopsis sp.]
MTTNYDQFPDLAGVYLEDSYVLAIREDADTVSFALEAVLTPQHPRYRPPQPDEQYCYAKANLVFTSVSEVRWLERSGLVFTDATGEADLGNIDTMNYTNDHYELTGDWGQVQIFTREPPRLVFT